MTCAGSLAGGCALFGALWLLGDVLGAALLTKIFVLPCTSLVHTQTRGYIRRKYGIQVRRGGGEGSVTWPPVVGTGCGCVFCGTASYAVTEF